MTSAMIKELVLYSYHLSSASWRIRAVLALKKIPFKYENVHLLNGEQHSHTFTENINPMHQVPALKVIDNDNKVHIITQSLAIIQFLEESFPEHPIFPKDSILRAKSRAIADTISAGIQPLQNLETLTLYKEALGSGEISPGERKTVAQYWITRKLENLEKLVKSTAGKFCVGDEITIADVCLVPQMFNARRFEIDTSKFPLLKEIDERLQQEEMFKSSHPTACPS